MNTYILVTLENSYIATDLISRSIAVKGLIHYLQKMLQLLANTTITPAFAKGMVWSVFHLTVMECQKTKRN